MLGRRSEVSPITARLVDHSGVTVPDPGEAVIFLVNALSPEQLYRAGPFEADDDRTTRRLGPNVRAHGAGIMHEPAVVMSAGLGAGEAWVYVRAPRAACGWSP